MSSWNFYQLTPATDHPPIQHLCDDCAVQADAEAKAHMDAAMTLGDALFDALDAYTDEHHETTYAMILQALHYMKWCLEQDLAEDEADA